MGHFERKEKSGTLRMSGHPENKTGKTYPCGKRFYQTQSKNRVKNEKKSCHLKKTMSQSKKGRVTLKKGHQLDIFVKKSNNFRDMKKNINL